MKKKGKIIKSYIKEKGLCTGCGLCSQMDLGIHLRLTNAGFYRPEFSKELDDDQWDQLAYVCPSLNMRYPSYQEEEIALYGQAKDSFIGWATSEDIRFKASSGGGLTAFLSFLLEHKKVDGILHVGRMNSPLVAEGVLSTKSEQVKAHLGSLYMPVPIFENLRSLLDQVDSVAVVGKGCDIRGLRRFVELYPQYKTKITLCMGILCGGVPSIQGTYNILNQFGMDQDEITEFRFRGYGWPGFCTAKTKDGRKEQMSYNDAWAKQLGPTSPLACKVCFDGIAEAADLVFGDAWKCEDGHYPSFEETDGRNLIICRSQKAVDLLRESVKADYIYLSQKKVDTHLFNVMQPSQSNRRYLAKLKVRGLRLMGYTYPKVNQGYLRQIHEASRVKLSIVAKIRTILGSMKRVKKGVEVR